MSNFVVFNSGIINSTISCIVYTKKDIKEIYQVMNNLFYCYKLTLKKSTGESQLNKSSINMNEINIKMKNDDFETVMDNILYNYYKIDEIREEGIMNFSNNKYNEKLGYKKIQDFDCWFIAMSIGPLKKNITEFFKANGINVKFGAYPKKETKSTSRQKKTVKKSTSSRIIKIEDDDNDDNENIEIPKPIIKPKQIKTKRQTTIIEDQDSDDEDNGIIKPIVKPKKSRSSSKSNSKSSKSKEDKIIKSSIVIKKTTSTDSDDSDDDIHETIIKKKDKKSKNSKISQEQPMDNDEIDIDVLSEVYTEEIPEIKDSSDEDSISLDTDDCWEEIEEPEPGEKRFHNLKTDYWTDDEEKTFPKSK